MKNTKRRTDFYKFIDIVRRFLPIQMHNAAQYHCGHVQAYIFIHAITNKRMLT